MHVTLLRRGKKMGQLSKNQKKILELLSVKPEMNTKEIAELLFQRIVKYQSGEYSSVHRSLISLEKQGCIQRVQVQLRWRVVSAKLEAI
jgi:DNA-binding MarR family transcriptional regulator